MLNFFIDNSRKSKQKNKKKKNVVSNNYIHFSLIIMAVAPILVSRTPSLDRDPVRRFDVAMDVNVQQCVENIISSLKCPAPYILDADGRARDISGSFLFFWYSAADIDAIILIHLLTILYVPMITVRRRTSTTSFMCLPI